MRKTMILSSAPTSIALVLVVFFAPIQCLEAGTIFKRPDGKVQLAENSFQKQKTGDEIAPLKKQFEKICGQTEIASSLSPEQLRELIIVSDQLLERLSSVTDPWAKVYIFRLKKCRDFFRFMLQSKEPDRQPGRATS